MATLSWKLLSPGRQEKSYHELQEMADFVQQMGVCACVCACVKKQAPCLCGQEVLGHTRFWFDKDPKLSSFSLSVARSARKL